MTRYKCTACDHIGLDPLFEPGEPPDPDRWGNLRFGYKCPECGARATVVDTRYGATGYDGLTPVDDRGHPTADRDA